MNAGVKNVVQFGGVLALFLMTITSFGQTDLQKSATELGRTMSTQHSITLQLDSAILLSHQEQFEAADKKFLYVLKNMRSIPADLTYHFGLNSYYLGKYKQSIDWLNKYIQLKGTQGQYSEKTVQWLDKAQQALLKQQEEERAKLAATTVVASNDFDIDCGPTGKVACPVCEGTTVIVKKGYFGDTYKTCPFCARKGYLNCEDYNRLIRGELKPAAN